jgi:hypothetical protein
MERLDTALGLSAVTNCLAHSHQTSIQASITNELLGPYLRKQLVFRDNTVAMGHQVGKDLKNLWPEFDRLAAV